MAAIDDLRAEAQELGVEFTDETSAKDLKALIKTAKENAGDGGEATESERLAAQAANFGFAVNAVKLNRAKGHVSKTQPDLKGKALEAAVKARYIEIGGLLTENKPTGPKAGGKRGGTVVNIADNDGSDD